MKEKIINVISITPEAFYDYKKGLLLGTLNQNQKHLKKDVADYIKLRKDVLGHKHYFRCKYLDEKNNVMLMLFIYRGNKLLNMQYWLLSGICLEDDWDEDFEDKGLIRLWLKTKIEDMPDGMDDVVVDRVKEIIKNTGKTKWENVLKEVLDAFNCERDKGYAEKLALLQKLHFDK